EGDLPDAEPVGGGPAQLSHPAQQPDRGCGGRGRERRRGAHGTVVPGLRAGVGTSPDAAGSVEGDRDYGYPCVQSGSRGAERPGGHRSLIPIRTWVDSRALVLI